MNSTHKGSLMHIREALPDDLNALTTIYNEVLLTSTAIYSDTPATVEDRTAWWLERRRLGYPVLVAAEDDAVVGFASFGDFRPWSGYRFTVEGSIHLAPEARGQGFGTALLDDLVDRAKALGKHTMIAGVDSENHASLGFLEHYGFERIAFFPEVGYKFGRFLSLHFLQFWLTPRTTASAPGGHPS